MKRTQTSQQDEALRRVHMADTSRAQDALDYALAEEQRAWQSNRDQVNNGAQTKPAHFSR